MARWVQAKMAQHDGCGRDRRQGGAKRDVWHSGLELNLRQSSTVEEAESAQHGGGNRAAERRPRGMQHGAKGNGTEQREKVGGGGNTGKRARAGPGRRPSTETIRILGRSPRRMGDDQRGGRFRRNHGRRQMRRDIKGGRKRIRRQNPEQEVASWMANFGRRRSRGQS